jgi:hypothetical protein
MIYYVNMTELELVKPKRKYELTPNDKKAACIAAYNNPESPTFGNALQSALSAGFAESYARNICGQKPKWFVENTRHGELMELAEQKLKHYLEIAPEDPAVMKIQQDTAKFVTANLGKERYSVRQEVRSDKRNGFSPQARLVVEKVFGDFLQPKETRIRIEQDLN